MLFTACLLVDTVGFLFAILTFTIVLMAKVQDVLKQRSVMQLKAGRIPRLRFEEMNSLTLEDKTGI